jgi:uncharacterized protein (TIGR00297 family)
MSTVDLIIYIILSLGATWSYLSHKLTLTGSLTGAAIGLLSYEGAGISGVAMMTLFFVLGSAATGWKRSQKVKINTAEKDHDPRTATQVLANSGVAAILSATAWHFPGEVELIKIMIAGSFAAATADTLSSELGMVYGKRFYNIISFKKDIRGLDGVVSLEGTLLGLAGAMLIAGVYAVGSDWEISFWWIVLAGGIGNLADSVLGAILERKGIIGNNVVNFWNTATGALVCWLLLQVSA